MNIITIDSLSILCTNYSINVDNEKIYSILKEVIINIRKINLRYEIFSYITNSFCNNEFFISQIDIEKILNIILRTIVIKLNKNELITTIVNFDVDTRIVKDILINFLYECYKLQNNENDFIQKLIIKNLYEIKKYINTLIFRNSVNEFDRLNINYNFLTYYKQIPTFLKFVCFYINKHYSNQCITMNNMSEVLEIIDETEKVENLNSLRNIGKNKLANIFINFNILNSDVILKQYFIFIFNSLIMYDYLENKILFLEIIIGYIFKKNPKIFEKINNDFFRKNKISHDLSEQNVIDIFNKNNDEFLVQQIIDNFNLNQNEIDNLKLSRYLFDDTDIGKNELDKKFNELYNGHYSKQIKLFLDKYYKNHYDEENYLNKLFINKYWKRNICVLCENNELFKTKNNYVEEFFYKHIYVSELNIGNDNKKIYYYNFPLSEKSNFDLIKQKEIIKDSYNKNLILSLLNDNIKKINCYDGLNLNNIDPIVFVDNNLLSASNRLKFSFYEQLGDILYKIIIIDLILDGRIKYSSNYQEIYLSSNFQNKLSKIIDLNKIIQTNNLHFGKDNKYNDADYFEAFIYEIYRTNGYKILKDFIIKILTKNQSTYIDKDIESTSKHYEWINIVASVINFSVPKLSLRFDGLSGNECVYKLIKELVESTRMLVYIKNAFDKGLFVEKNRIFRTIFLPDDYNDISFYWSMYSLFINDFESFFDCCKRMWNENDY